MPSCGMSLLDAVTAGALVPCAACSSAPSRISGSSIPPTHAAPTDYAESSRKSYAARHRHSWTVGCVLPYVAQQHLSNGSSGGDCDDADDEGCNLAQRNGCEPQHDDNRIIAYVCAASRTGCKTSSRCAIRRRWYVATPPRPHWCWCAATISLMPQSCTCAESSTKASFRPSTS